MKLAYLKKIHEGGASDAGADARMRGTEAQDVTRSVPLSLWQRQRLALIIAGGLLLVLLCAWLLHGWLATGQVITRERLRVATVDRGHYVRDVAAEGTVVAAVNPTLFAIAPGTVTYQVRAGDPVSKGQLLAVLDSPELMNDYRREQATLDSLDAALERQQIEIRREILTSKQQADLAQVAIQAAQRELKRSQWAWDQRVISERDYMRSIDDVANAKLNFDHARDTADLERDSLALDLRTKRLERDRQALTVADLKQRIAELSVRSPVDGMVANLAQPQKTRLAADAPLLTVVDLSAFEIEFQVAESYAADIKPGMSADITIEGRRVPGVVTAISPEVRQNQVVGRVRFRNGQPAGLRQNERTAVRIVLDERDHVLKFERGSFIDDSTRTLYVLRGARAVRVPVELGAASVSEIEVIRGLAPGEQVIISDMRDANQAAELAISN
ncbi:MAG TPA: HlyD family efflux transporter periplasmic adaptor subunit [Steroidobacteraceae bacterium]|jgi:HlyD family secretion protein|nr:HlyD family efflux transporter periplasmic adaptor subunit [Steroidobacteraceae bacterium]